MKPTGATQTKLGEVVDVAPEEGQLALVDVHELVVKRIHHSLVQVELLHGVASVKGTFKGTIENESERNGKYFQTVKKISKQYHSQKLPTLVQLERATSPVLLFLKWGGVPLEYGGLYFETLVFHLQRISS